MYTNTLQYKLNSCLSKSFFMRSVTFSAEDGLVILRTTISKVQFCYCNDLFNAILLYLIVILFLFNSNVLHYVDISMDAATFGNSRCRSESLEEPQKTRH